MSYSRSVSRQRETYVEKVLVYIYNVLRRVEARRHRLTHREVKDCQGWNIFVELRMVNVVWYRLYGTVHAEKVGNFGTEMQITESNSKGQCCRCQD